MVRQLFFVGFSTYWLSVSEYDPAQCAYTLGIDCSGLVHRCSKYENSKYVSASKKIHNINAKMFMGKKATTLNGETVWVDEADPTYSIAIQKDTWMVQKGRWDNIQNVVTGYQLRRLKRN